MVALKIFWQQLIVAVLWCAAVLLSAQAVCTAAESELPAASQAAAHTRQGVRGVAHAALWPRSRSTGLLDPDTEIHVTELMSRMSLAEKVGQIIQADIGYVTPEDLRQYPLGAVLAGGDSSPGGGTDRSAAAWLATARTLQAVSIQARPGHTPIPILFGVDAVHGNNGVSGATIFPHNIGLGATHDPALVGRIGAATAQEMAAVGIDWAFAPALSVPHDLRWGRSYESYSQDPALVRRYAGEIVRGLQGEPDATDRVQSGHVAATAKHFVGDGGTRAGIDEGDSELSERELIRIHAQGYRSAIEAGVMTVMASFSSWQGRKVHGNASLLTDVLKGRLGFDGFVVGDWNGHGQIPGCSSTRCAAALKAGIDMFMAPDGWKELFDNTLAQLQSGDIPQARLDDAVRRILRVKLKLGLFEPARPWEGRFDALASSAHRALARTAVRESLVLLKNDRRVLPIRATARVLVAGDAADDIGRQCGGWTLGWQGSGNRNGEFAHAESIYAGIRAALEAGGGSAQFSADGRHTGKPDVAIVVFGEQPYAESVGDLGSIDYQAGERRDLALLHRLRAEHIPVVSVFLSGRPLWVSPQIDASNAFVAAWLPGSEGGGIADLLIGDANGHARYDFSGTLSFAWPATRTAANGAPRFALGYGLSYAEHAARGALP